MTGRLAATGIVLVAIAACGCAWVALRSARNELSLLKAQSWPIPRSPEEAWLTAALDVEYSTGKGVRIRGWMVPSSNGAAVLLITGSETDRRQLLPEARLLADAGYGVLLFDLPGTGQSEGARWQGHEQDAVESGVEFLARQPGVHSGSVGIFGFSVGAALAIEAAARGSRVGAFVLAGCFADVQEQTQYEYRRYGRVSQWPALWVDQHFAQGMEGLRPLAHIAAIAPRPVLFIAGDADPFVPNEGSRALYRAAREPKELWIVPGAGHGGYATAASAEYARRLLGVFALLVPRELSHADSRSKQNPE
jgi:pimeloyl-ACP methyl ester carboxylesterase